MASLIPSKGKAEGHKGPISLGPIEPIEGVGFKLLGDAFRPVHKRRLPRGERAHDAQPEVGHASGQRPLLAVDERV